MLEEEGRVFLARPRDESEHLGNLLGESEKISPGEADGEWAIHE